MSATCEDLTRECRHAESPRHPERMQAGHGEGRSSRTACTGGARAGCLGGQAEGRFPVQTLWPFRGEFGKMHKTPEICYPLTK